MDESAGPDPVAWPDRDGDGPPAAAQALALGGSLALSYGAAAAGQWATSRSLRDWYPALKKPAWTPPGRVIGAVWTVLYGLMGLSLWLDWRRAATSGAPGGEPSGRPGGQPGGQPGGEAEEDDQPAQAIRPAAAWFGAQLALNVLWSFAFFAARSTGRGLAVIGALWLAVAGWVRAAGRTDRLAGRLQYPYLAWVSFAGLLNATIWWLNRGPDAQGAKRV